MKTKKVLIFVLTLLLCVCFCACSSDNEKQSSTAQHEDEPKTFSVTVVDNNGDAVQGVFLQLRNESGITARTNSEGIAVFPMVTISGYRLSVLSCPDGYEYTGIPNIPIKKDTKEFTLQITKK